MNWQQALTAHREWLEAAQRRCPLKELRSRLADLRPPRALPAPPLLGGDSATGSTPTVGGGSFRRSPGGLLLPDSSSLLAVSGSEFSLEALIAAELNVKATEKSLKAPEIPVMVEIKRQPMPLVEPRPSLELKPPLIPAMLDALKAESRMLLLWTDPLYYGGQTSDLTWLSGWYQERLDERPMPILLRGELFVHPYQLFETRLLGGEAVLISPEPLTRNQLEDLVGTALELRLLPLVYLTDARWLGPCLDFGVKYLVVGEGALFDAAARVSPGMGPLRELSRELPLGCGSYGLGGVASLAALDARAYAGASGVFAGRGYTTLQVAVRRRQEEG